MARAAATLPSRSADEPRTARSRGVGRRIALAATAVLAAIAVAVVLYAWLRGAWLIGHTIERIGSQVTDTAVRVAAADVAWTDRRIDLDDLSVANPRGFAATPALRFGAIAMDVGDVVERGPIVLDALRVLTPAVRVEIHEHARLNILVLRDQIRASARAGRPGPPPAELGDVLADCASRAHIRVERLSIAPARVTVDASKYGPDEPVELTLAPVELADVGGTQGVTPAELTRTITLALIESTIASIAKADVRGSREGIPEALGAIRRTGRRLLEREP